jgi:lipoyl-dependent peroxiredoxin
LVLSFLVVRLNAPPYDASDGKENPTEEAEMPTRTASACWNGSLRDGDGTMRLGSGAYEGAYSFRSRFEEGEGTNPEELIGAAHAGCFSMALSADLGRAGHTVESIATDAAVQFEPVEGVPTITGIELSTTASVPGIEQDEFDRVAEGAKQNCPVSRALAGVDISLDARLEG